MLKLKFTINLKSKNIENREIYKNIQQNMINNYSNEIKLHLKLISDS